MHSGIANGPTQVRLDAYLIKWAGQVPIQALGAYLALAVIVVAPVLVMFK